MSASQAIADRLAREVLRKLRLVSHLALGPVKVTLLVLQKLLRTAYNAVYT